MRKLREWMNRKKRAKHFKMYQLEPGFKCDPDSARHTDDFS